jgi:O-antigen/teichoic acid export membrane protein
LGVTFHSAMKERKIQSSETRKLLKKSAFLYLSFHIFTFFRFLTGFLVARFLGPTLYGLRTLFGLVLEYASFSHMGTLDAMRREVPYFRGKDDEREAELILNNVFGVNFLYSLVVFALMIGAAFYLHYIDYEAIYIDFVLFFGVYGIAEKIKSFYTVKLAIDKKPHILSKIRLLEGVTHTAACVFLTFYFGLRGLLLGLLISCLIVVVTMYAMIREIPKIYLSSHVIWRLLKIGFPIMVISLMFILLRSIDRIIIAVFLSKQMLGYFAIGTIVSGLIYFSIAEVSRVIFGPLIMEKLGNTGDSKLIKNYLTEPTIVISYCTPLLVGTVYLGIDVLIRYFLPEYIPAIDVAQILILGAYFLSIIMVPSLVCVSLNKQVYVVFLIGIVVVFDAVLSYSLVAMGWGIQGVAMGTCVSYFLLSLLGLSYAMRQFDAKVEEYLKFFALIYAPFVYALCLVILLERFVILDLNGFWIDVFMSAVRICLFILMFSVIFAFLKDNTVFKKVIDCLPFYRGNAIGWN